MGRSKSAHRLEALKSYHIVIKPEAEADAEDAALWYENQRVGLGHEFLLAVDSTIQFVSRHPEQFQIRYKDIRGVFIKRFPYGVYYHVDEDTVLVFAIHHTARKPNSWKSRKS